MQRDLMLAAEVQRGMLPQKLPTLAGYSFWVWWQPALEVGGDLYDFRTLPTGEILVVVADVAGKGLAAALGMAALAGAIPVLLEQTGSDLTKFVAAANRSVASWAFSLNRFVTLLAVALDPLANRLRIVNAGHATGFIRRQDGKVETICPDQFASVPLGVSETLPFQETAFVLAPGDSVVMLSDGITDAANAAGEEFGISRAGHLPSVKAPIAVNLGEALLANVRVFVGGQDFKDDVVVTCFARELPGSREE